MELFKGFEEVAMTLVGMEIGDADDDEIIRLDSERFSQFRIRGDGIEICDVDTVRNDGYFLRLYADIFDIEIFDRFGVGKILIDEWFGEPFNDASNEIFRMIVGGTKEGDDRSILRSKQKPAEHISVKEIGNDNIRIFFPDEFAETENTRNIEKAVAMNRFDCDTSRNEF